MPSSARYAFARAAAVLAIVGGSFAVAEEELSVEQQLRKLIPEATAIDRDLFMKMATSPQGPRREMFEEVSLTAALMMLEIKERKDDDPPPQFRYLVNGPPKPSNLAREMSRSVGAGKLRFNLGPVTMVHEDRVTNCQTKIDGDTATGSFEFRVPKQYEGNADFVAKRNKDDQWQIVEIQMTAEGIHIKRNDEGRWRRVAASQEQP